jgi:DNA-binding transcriptional regulator LsrR (DeoR family)
MRAVVKAGGGGENRGWAFEAAGPLTDGLTHDRVLSVPLQQPVRRRMIGVAMAPSRLKAIRGALRGKLLNGLITNELMAERLLK